MNGAVTNSPAAGNGVTVPIRHLLALIVPLNLVTFLVVWLVFTPLYYSNDDVQRMLIASGFPGGEPSDFIPFSYGSLLGLVTSQLYGWAPDFDWYSLIIVVAHFIGMTALGFALLSRRPVRFNFLLYLGLLLFFETRQLVRLQFTTAAFILSLGGVALLLNRFRLSLPVVILGGVLAAAGAAIRYHSALLLAVLLLPLLCVIVLRGRWRPVAAFGVGVLLFFGIFTIAERYVGGRPLDWQKFMSRQAAISRMVDAPQTEDKELREVARKAAGWTDNDLWLAKSWFYLDGETFSRERFSAYSEIAQERRSLGASFAAATDQALEATSLFGLLITITFVGFSLLRGTTGARMETLVAVGAAVGVILLLSMTAKLPRRVFLSILLYVSVVAAMGIGEMATSLSVSRRQALRFCFAVGVVLCVVAQVVGLFEMRRRALEKRHAMLCLIEHIQEERGSVTILLHFPLEGIRPFGMFEEFGDMKFIPNYWLTQSPYWNRLTRELGFEDLKRDLYRDERVRIVIQAGKKELLEQYMREHFETNAKLVPVYRMPFGSRRNKDFLLCRIRVRE